MCVIALRVRRPHWLPRTSSDSQSPRPSVLKIGLLFRAQDTVDIHMHVSHTVAVRLLF